MVNYEYGKIYKITSESTGFVYYGSTAQKYLSQRLSGHLGSYKSYLNGKCDYVTSFELLKCEDYKMELIKYFPSVNKKQLTTEEAKYIRCNDCVNKVIPDRTRKEYHKEYQEQNKEKINEYGKEYREGQDKEQKKEYNKEYYQENKEKIKEHIKEYKEQNEEKIKKYKKQYYQNNKEQRKQYREQYYQNNKERSSKPYHCACGSVIVFAAKSKHFKTNKHCQYINTPQH